MKRLFALLLSVILLTSLCLPLQAADINHDPTMKIGLYYGVNALPSANLQNVTGMDLGYELGYFDSSTRVFCPLYYVADYNKLTVLKDKPMWIAGDNTYYDIEPSSYNVSVGSYHLEMDLSFTDMFSISEMVTSVNQLGFSAFPAFVNGVYRVRIGDYITSDAALADLEAISLALGYPLTVVGQSSTCYTVTVTGTNTILFEFDHQSLPLGINPASEQTWFKGYKYYGGFEYNRINGNDITVINMVGMNDYIKGVIPYEMSPSWPIEALKAQAVCARCYAMHNKSKHRSLGFDLCNTTDCQVYYGTNNSTANSNAAVDETYGIYAIYNGKVAQTYYHSSSGGYTEDAVNIWGSNVPYLKAVEDTYLVRTLPYSFSVTLSDITEILQSKGYTNKQVTDYYVSKYSAVGNVLAVSFTLSDGSTLTLKGDRARTAINSTAKDIHVGSHRYTISGNTSLYINGSPTNASLSGTYAIGGDGTVSQMTVGTSDLRVITSNGVESVSLTSSSDYLVSGTGSGHNIGMSQWGAHAMAQLGFTYDEIIRFYFTGVDVGYLN